MTFDSDANDSATHVWAREQTERDVLRPARLVSLTPRLDRSSIRLVSDSVGGYEVFIAKKSDSDEICLIHIPVDSEVGASAGCARQGSLADGPIAVTTINLPESNQLWIMGVVADRVTHVRFELGGAELVHQVDENVFNVLLDWTQSSGSDVARTAIALLSGGEVLSSHVSVFSGDSEVAMREHGAVSTEGDRRGRGVLIIESGD